jgi:ribosomal protein S18 acetylase RimI-like enzyme
MRHYEHLQWGTDQLRLSPWRGDPTIAELAPALAGRPVTAPSIRRGLELVAGRGYRGVLTNALSPEEQHGYLEVGFEVRERLHLLSRSLDDLPPRVRSVRLRRGRRRDRAGILGIDAAAFDPFWRLDELGLHEAIGATPTSRLRVNAGGPVVGYAVTGRAGTRGYLQRLAVHPEHHRQGLGTALVTDALHWLRRRGVHTAVVNTQEANAVALGLYHHLGFASQPHGLAVLSYQFEPA